MGNIKDAFVSGTILNNPLAIGGTTLSAAGLAGMSAIASPDIAKVILDPAGSTGNPEVVYVTAHTALATTATILRGQEGTAARQMALGTAWVEGATTLDWGRAVGAPNAYNPLDEFLRPRIFNDSTPSTVSTWPLANRAIFTPMEPLQADCSIVSITFAVGTQSGNIDVGVYMYDSTTFTKIVSSGSVACPAANTNCNIAVATTPLYKGTRYWFAMALDNATAKIAIATYAGIAPNVAAVYKASSFPLPATVTAPTSFGSPVLMYGNVNGGGLTV